MHLEADLHVHTVSSGHAYSTVAEYAACAARKGLKMIAVTDHGPAMPGGPHLYHFGNLNVLPLQYRGVEILRGVEANIVDREGKIDIPRAYLRRLDWVMAGFHTYCFPGGSVAENTEAMINAMKNPHVDAIVHPGNPEFQVEVTAVVEAAREYGVALEINNSSLGGSREGSETNCHKIAQLAAEKGITVIVSSDAHWCEDVGSFARALELVQEAGIKPEQILNASVTRIREYLSRKKAILKDYDAPKI